MRTNLQAMRKAAGYSSAKAFAEAIEMSVNTYTAYEQGRHSFTLEQAWQFADALGCTLDELAGREWPKAAGNPYHDELADAYDRASSEGKRAIMTVARSVAETSGGEKEHGDAGEVSA